MIEFDPMFVSTTTLENIPFPPSTNQLFAGKTRRYKSQKYKFWSQEFDIWALKHISAVRGASKFVREYLAQGPDNFITLGIELNVTPQMIFTKDGRNKRIDAHNFTKALIDAISEELKCDDSRFFLSNVEFVCYDNKDFSPNVTITLEKTRLRRRGTTQEKNRERLKENENREGNANS